MAGISFNAEPSSGSDFSDIFFNRPVNRIVPSKVAILASRYSSVRGISTMFLTLASMGHSPVLIADSELKAAQVPAELFLESKDKIHYYNSDEAIAMVMDCQMLVILPGNELGSSMQLMISRIMNIYDGFVASDYPRLFLDNPTDTPRLCFGPTRNLLSLVKYKNNPLELGLQARATLLMQASTLLKASLISIDNNQALVVHESDKNNICIINTKDAISTMALVAIQLGLLADRSSSSETSWLRYAQAGGFLYRNSYSQGSNGPELLKGYLDKQF